jgi:hypothetical protein
MVRIVARTHGAQHVAANSDVVLGGMPIPTGGRLINVSGELHLITANEDQPLQSFYAYGFAGEVVPIVESDVADDYQEIWNNVVVKASTLTTSAGNNNLDFDWDTADSSPTIEPGELDVDALLGMTQGSKEIFAPRIEWISWAKNRQGGFVAGTPDDWQPSDFKTFRSARPIVAEVPSAAMLTISNPNLDQVISAAADLTPASEAQWYMLQNMEDTMKEVGKFQAGLSEIGAETPGDIASILLQTIVAKAPVTDTGLFRENAWTAMCSATWILEFPDDSIPNTLDGS